MKATTTRPLPAALRDQLDEREWSQRRLAREIQERTGGVSVAYLNQLVQGKMPPTPPAMESIAKALNINPDYYAEYRLHLARDRLDPEAVGLERALRNLGETP